MINVEKSLLFGPQKITLIMICELGVNILATHQIGLTIKSGKKWVDVSEVKRWKHGILGWDQWQVSQLSTWGSLGLGAGFFLFQRMVSDLQRSTIIDFISSLLLLLLFSLVVSEEDSEKMRKNNNNNKRSDFVLSGKRSFNLLFFKDASINL